MKLFKFSRLNVERRLIHNETKETRTYWITSYTGYSSGLIEFLSSSVLNAFSPRFYWTNRLPPSDERWYLFHFTEYKLSLLLLLFAKLSREYAARTSIFPFLFFFLRIFTNFFRKDKFSYGPRYIYVFGLDIASQLVKKERKKEKKSIYDLTTIIRWLWVNLGRWKQDDLPRELHFWHTFDINVRANSR